MKIAYFINQYPKVSHSFVRREILALEKLGLEVERIALRGWSEQLPDPEDQREQARTRYVLRGGVWSLLLPAAVVLTTMPLRFFGALGLARRMARESDRSLLYHLVYLAEACRVLLWVRKSKVERLHAHFGTNSAEVAMLVGRLGAAPYSFTIHGPDEFLRPMGLQEKIQYCDFVVAISSFGRSQIYLRSRWEDWGKVKIVHCGLQGSFFDAPRTAVQSRPRLVCIGRLCAAKGQLLLVEAAARLRAANPGFELVLAGDGEMRPAVEARIAELGLEDTVRITGWISSDEVRAQLLAARAMVLPSFAEGLPVVIMEALALRRPVISTYVAGIPELVLDGVNGWLIPAGDLDALVDAMQKCLRASDEEMERLGQAGHERVMQRHSIETEAAKLIELFRQPSALTPRV